MISWKTTIGGAFSALGSTLMAIGIVPQLSGAPSRLLSAVTIVGFVCNAVGAFLAHLFAADAADLKTVADYAQVTRAAVITGDHAALAVPVAPVPVPTAPAPVVPAPSPSAAPPPLST
jgi:hypothetical protein